MIGFETCSFSLKPALASVATGVERGTIDWVSFRVACFKQEYRQSQSRHQHRFLALAFFPVCLIN